MHIYCVLNDILQAANSVLALPTAVLKIPYNAYAQVCSMLKVP